MSDTVIKVENLSKQYRLGELGTGTLSHDPNRWWHKVRGKEDPYLKIGEANDRSTKGNSEYVWALRDINFEVKQGEVLGIIGKNGAGKSTLLKLLSRVTAPTTGRIKAKGRVASLLEVGTGFHEELTGRENIFLNGAILGMTKAEIKSKFDEIVAFSGTERYIDTPVKRYSSGMRVRLAFAVAAHLDPEILIVDEVLAVGDAEFQKKAIGKMQEVSKGQGRTVLFVSHNLAIMNTLCDNGILLSSGTVCDKGLISKVINSYSASGTFDNSSNLTNGFVSLLEKKKNSDFGLMSVLIYCDDKITLNATPGSDIKFIIEYDHNDKIVDEPVLGFVIKDRFGVPLIGINNRHIGCKIEFRNFGKYIIHIHSLPIFQNGMYTVDLYYGNKEDNEDTILDAFYFNIIETDIYRSGKLLNPDFNKIYLKDVFITTEG